MDPKTRAALIASYAGLIASVVTAIYTVFVIGPEIRERNAAADQANAATEQAAVETKSAAIDVRRKQPSVQISYHAATFDSIVSEPRPDEFANAKMRTNDVWSITNALVSQMEGNGWPLCGDLIPDPALAAEPAALEAMQASLEAIPCGGGLSFMEFLRVEITGDLSVAEMVLTGTKSERDGTAVPLPFQDCDGPYFLEPYSKELVAQTSPPAVTPTETFAGALNPGEAVIIPLLVRTVDGIDLGVQYDYTSLRLLDVDGQVLAELPIREQFIEEYVDAEALLDEPRIYESC
jgi:hypothetical protein